MTCRSCGATIADKAIVCYRCGTPTEDHGTPGRIAKARRSTSFRTPLIVLIVVLLVGLGTWLLMR